MLKKGRNSSVKKVTNSKLKVALVCDWLTTVGGAESVLLTLHQMYPDAPIYTSKYDRKGIDWFDDANVITGYLQLFPTKIRRFISPLRQYYFSHLDLSDYDLVISVTGAEAKSVKTRTSNKKTEHDCVHLCYCHVPTQYYWGMYESYLENPGFGFLDPIVRIALKILVKPLRKKDFKAAQGPDQFITISNYAKEQIRKYYEREAIVIAPPVDVEKFSTGLKKLSTSREIKRKKSQVQDCKNYIITSRQVNWKKIDLCVKACINTGDHLLIIGDGPEHNNLLKLADRHPNIEFLPTMTHDELKKYLAEADAFLFPSLEPFGLAPIEAMACGTPVIAYKQGGALDYIQPGINGEFFEVQSVKSLVDALKKFQPEKYQPNVVKNTTLKFDRQTFISKIQKVVEKYDKSN